VDEGGVPTYCPTSSPPAKPLVFPVPLKGAEQRTPRPSLGHCFKEASMKSMVIKNNSNRSQAEKIISSCYDCYKNEEGMNERI